VRKLTEMSALPRKLLLNLNEIEEKERIRRRKQTAAKK
jgi:hypothetical protein